MNAITAIDSPTRFDTIIDEDTETHLTFNVMPDRPVHETLHVRQYAIAPGYIEARFDRSYASAMKNSPSHLIFLTALVHAQKLIYVYACHELGLTYDPYGPEVLKIWPTSIQVEMPRMLRDEQDLVHRVHIDSFEPEGPRRYMLKLRSSVNDSVNISGRTPLFVL